MEIEQELCWLLREVSLVGELDLSLNGDIYGMAKSVAAPLIRQRSWDALADDCPAATVIFLVADGVHRYRGGAFWPYVSVVGIYDGNNQGRVGRAFLEALRTIALETFSSVIADERGLRFVGPILLHGGIPKYCAPDAWLQITETVTCRRDDGGGTPGPPRTAHPPRPGSCRSSAE